MQPEASVLGHPTVGPVRGKGVLSVCLFPPNQTLLSVMSCPGLGKVGSRVIKHHSPRTSQTYTQAINTHTWMRVRLLSHPRPGGKVEVILVGAGSFGTVRLVGPGRVVKVIKTDMDQGIREIVAYKVFDTIDQSLAVTCYEARVFSCGAIELDLGQGYPWTRHCTKPC